VVSNDETMDLYNDLKNQILNLGNDIEIRPTKKYVAFRRKQQFVGIVFLKEKLKLYLNADSSQLQDPFNKVRDVSNIGHYSSGNSEIIVSHPSDIPVAFSLIRQVYEKS
jgi:predicted transport protein